MTNYTVFLTQLSRLKSWNNRDKYLSRRLKNGLNCARIKISCMEISEPLSFSKIYDCTFLF